MELSVTEEPRGGRRCIVFDPKFTGPFIDVPFALTVYYKVFKAIYDGLKAPPGGGNTCQNINARNQILCEFKKMKLPDGQDIAYFPPNALTRSMAPFFDNMPPTLAFYVLGVDCNDNHTRRASTALKQLEKIYLGWVGCAPCKNAYYLYRTLDPYKNRRDFLMEYEK
jgi:hypothetical protein